MTSTLTFPRSGIAAKEANYDLTATATVHIFAQRFRSQHARAPSYTVKPYPLPMAECGETPPRMEKEKYTYRQSFMYPDPSAVLYKWVSPQQQRHNGNRRHPNDEASTYGHQSLQYSLGSILGLASAQKQIRTASKQEGRCFFCDQQGHMARTTVQSKKQQFSEAAPSKAKRNLSIDPNKAQELQEV